MLSIETRYIPGPIDCDLWELRYGELPSVDSRVRLRRLSECTCIGVVFALHTQEHARRKGYARILLTSVETHAREHGITLLACTVVDSNQASLRLFESLGYGRVVSWFNPATGHKLVLFTKAV